MRFWALDLNAWRDHFPLGICVVDRPPSTLTMLLSRHTRPFGVVIDPPPLDPFQGVSQGDGTAGVGKLGSDAGVEGFDKRIVGRCA